MLICTVKGCTRLAGGVTTLCWVHKIEKAGQMDRLIAFAKSEQMYLWDDLSRDIRVSSNGVWSTEAEATLWRLLQCLKAVPAIDYDSVPWMLLGSDIWSTILDLAKIPHAEFKEDTWKWFEQRLSTFGGTREELLLKYEETRATLKGLSIWEQHGA